jgi:hypothetical protein
MRQNLRVQPLAADILTDCFWLVHLKYFQSPGAAGTAATGSSSHSPSNSNSIGATLARARTAPPEPSLANGQGGEDAEAGVTGLISGIGSARRGSGSGSGGGVAHAAASVAEAARIRSLTFGDATAAAFAIETIVQVRATS